MELFEYLFRDIQIQRATANNSRSQIQTVPISYVAGEKYMEQAESDPDLTKSVAIQLPRMAYDIVSFRKDETRQLNPMNKLYFSANSHSEDIRFVPVPYNLVFELYLKARNTEDAFKIVEQIVPYFTPFFSVKAALLDGQPPFKVNLTINDSSKADRYEGQISDKRDLQWVMSFTMNSWLFGTNIGANGSHVIRWVNTQESILSSVGNNAFRDSTNTYIYEANTAIGDILPTDNYTIIVDKSEING